MHSVLNLDKDHSKFFIGGLPPSFEAPSSIEYTTYSGQMQDVTVNGEPIGLWNFIEILKPDDVPLQGAINGSVERLITKCFFEFYSCIISKKVLQNSTFL